MYRNGSKTVLFCIIFLIIFSFTAGASGNQEDRLDEASRLIDAKEYNDALLVLTDMLKKNPDRLDDVQGLLDRIRTEKELYNDKYEELLATYGGDEVEAAYPIIKELEQMDPNPNEATRISLVLARETAGFVFNNNRWVDIMERASLLLEEEEYDAAVKTYEEGFDLSRDIFLDSGYGNVIVNEINLRAEDMAELSAEFNELYPRMLEQTETLNESFSEGNMTEYISGLEAFYPNLSRSAEIREALKDTADYFIVQESNLRRNSGNDKQVHYLIYLDRLLNGRTSFEELEGITGSIELYWNSVFERIAKSNNSFSADLFAKAVEEFEQGDFEAAGVSFADAVTAAESFTAFFDFGEQYFESIAQFERPGLLLYDDETFRSEKYKILQQQLTAQSFIEIIARETNIAQITGRIDDIQESEAFRADGEVIKQELRTEADIVRRLFTDAEQRAEQATAEYGTAAGYADAVEIAAMPSAEYRRLTGELLQTDISLTAGLFRIDLDNLELDYISAEESVNESSALIEGVVGEDAAEPAEGEDFQLTVKYPDKALEQLLSSERSVNSLIDEIDELESLIAAEDAAIRAGAEVAAVADGVETLMNKSGQLLQNAVRLGDIAREQIFTAEKLKQEGEKRIEDSKLLTQKAQFAAAKERLEQAAAKFDESLSYLEDPILRAFRDNEIPRLYEEIQVAENNLVVRQVREYLTTGKTFYSQGNFPSAQSVLIKAQSRWSDTNIEPNAEVEYWLTLTQTALTVTSGRVIAATDPLYSEMNQYLNQAQADFEAAKKEINRGRRSEADVYFIRAEQNILFVQQFFPLNEEARILNLMISQYRDPEQFNQVFRSDFIEARNLIGSNPQKAYIDLKDLEAINPGYPGLSAAITEAEYASGIKVRPPDPAKISRSKELYNLAFDIVSRNVRSEFAVAQSYLDEAISLNPDNQDAIRLKDRISTDVGGTAVAVMSSTDQQRYEEAVSEFTAGNFLKARIIVENLLQNPVNQRNPKLIDLKERLERER